MHTNDEEKCPNLLKDRYIAGIVLSGVGDSLGYRKEEGLSLEELNDLKSVCGLTQVQQTTPDLSVSGSTFMHLATAKALCAHRYDADRDKLLRCISLEYKLCENKISGTDTGKNDKGLIAKIFEYILSKVKKSPISENGYYAAVRSMCIGLRYPKSNEVDDLIAVSIESAILTDDHPTGYLGSLASALFASYAVQGKPIREWGFGLVKTLKDARIRIGKKVSVEENHWSYFESKWRFYLRIRNILDGKSDPRFPPDDNLPKKRDQFYTLLSYNGMGGASDHDAPMIAYDAILGCNGMWDDLCDRAIFHKGNSHSTGTIAGCLFGILYGLPNFTESSFKEITLLRDMKTAAIGLFELASGENDMGNNGSTIPRQKYCNV